MLFSGSLPALITPFHSEKIDESAFRKLIDWQIAQGSSGLVPCGTTGEAPTLTYPEHERMIEIAVEQANKKVPVMAGCGSNATENAIKLTKQAKKAGAQATLHVTPYYNKPTQEGLFRHFEKIAMTVDIPIILYNVPSRTAVSLDVETVLRLSKIDLIIGIKEASGNLENIDRMIKETPKNFAVFSGDDPFNAQIYTLGGHGTISVTANIVPSRVAKVWSLFAGDKKTALAEQEKLQALNKILFIETNPIPVKTALHLMGKCTEEFRLPLCPMSEANKKILKEALKKEGLIK